MGNALLQWSPAIGTVFVALIYGAFKIVNRRGGEKARREPSWVELVEENRNLRKDLTDLGNRFDQFVDEQRKKDAAKAAVDAIRDQAIRNVLATAAEAWPADTAGPVFESNDIDALSDTLPRQWRRAPRKAKPA